MKRLLFSIFLFGILIVMAGDIFAQTVKVSAEVRPRYEYRHGYKTLFPDGQTPASFVSQRTRLNGFFGNKTFKAYVSLQDVRVWGDVSQLNTSDVNGFSVHEAWGQVRFADVLHLKVGRMEIVYDDHRIFGSVGWAQQARSHDAAVLKFFFGKNNKMDVGVAFNAAGESSYKINYSNINNYKTIQWLHYHGDYGENHGLSALFLNNGVAYDADNNAEKIDENIAYSQTMGARYTLKFKVVKFDTAIYYQLGKTRKGNYSINYLKDLRAFYLSANVTILPVKFFNIGFGFEYLSGTSSINQRDKNSEDHSFTPLYGTNHKFNGWMDYFYVGSYNGQNGLVDFYLPIKFKVSKWNFGLIPHTLLAAAKVSAFNSNGDELNKDYKNLLGIEIDFVVGFTLSKSVNLQAGASQMFATETMQVVKYSTNPNADYYKGANQWAWIMVTFKPTFFSKE